MLYKDNITKRMGLEEAIAERVEETGTEHHIYLEMLRKGRGAQRFCDDSAAVFRHGKHPIQVSSRRAFHRRTPGKRRWREVSMYSNRSAEP